MTHFFVLQDPLRSTNALELLAKGLNRYIVRCWTAHLGVENIWVVEMSGRPYVTNPDDHPQNNAQRLAEVVGVLVARSRY